MIRLIGKRLIIPRGDTGSFSIPYLKTINAGDVAVFTIFDPRTHTKLYQKLVAAEGDVLNIAFSHSDTVNLKPGKYLWDIKFYTNPQFVDDELVNGDEIDSYYAGFTLPECEIRQTGDTLLTSDDAPTSTISPESLDIINAAINEVLKDKGIAAEAAETAVEKAAEAAESATSASTSASAAEQSAALAVATVNEIENLSVEVSTGEEGTEASVTYTPSTGILNFEIPRGNTGNGIASCVLNNDFTLTINYTNGDSITTIPIHGDTPHLTIGEVTEGPHAIATITGTDANPILNLTLPNANVPTKLSQLTDDIGVAGKANSADLATVATSGSYNDLSNKPFIPSAISDLTDDSGHYTKPAGGIPASDLANGVLDVWSGLTYHTSTMSTDSDSFVLGGATDSPTEINKCLVTSTPGANVIPKFDYQGRLHSVTPEEEWDGSNAVATTQYVDTMITNNMPEVPTNMSELNNDAGYLTQHQDLSNYVQKTDYATKDGNYGLVKINVNKGLTIAGSDGTLITNTASSSEIKAGDNMYKPIVPGSLDQAVFYGLAKAADDSTQSSSNNSVGSYTTEAKSAIHEMLDGSVAVSGTAPSITPLSGVRYVCGEVLTLNVTLPSSGIVDIVFTSGSTATVLTITAPSGVTLKWANNFNPASLNTNTTYEINIMDGLGVAASWT